MSGYCVEALDYVIKPYDRTIDYWRSNEARWKILKDYFSGGADSMNWLVASTSGVHGSYTTIEDIEKTFHLDPDHEDSNGRTLTILIIQPRRCFMMCGNVEIRNEDDIKWLKETIGRSLEEMRESQVGNLDKSQKRMRIKHDRV